MTIGLNSVALIKQMKGEQGRELFHEISQFYPGYTEEECDTKYDSIMKSYYHFRYNIIDEIASKYGIDLTNPTSKK